MRLNPLTQIQYKYHEDWDHRFFVNPAGRQSRKTIIGISKVRDRAMRTSGAMYFHAAPTWQQAKNIFWKRLHLFYQGLILSESVSEMTIRLANETEIFVFGLDKPERIEGQTYDGCHITEMGKIKENAFEESVRPALAAKEGFALLDGVPKGRNHYYELAMHATDSVLPQTVQGRGAFKESKQDPLWCYYHWFSIDVLTPAEIEAQRQVMDEKTFRQELLGSFETYEGLAYDMFSSLNLKTIKYNPRKTVHIGMDFNVDPMTAVFCHIEGDDLYQFGEAYLKNSNTFEMRDHIAKRFPVANCIVYPDATAGFEESNASKSDIAILEKAGFKIRANKYNPKIVDRVNAVNSKIKAGGKAHYFVNPSTCPKTLNDLNKVERLKDGRLDKTQEKDGLKHITDALGYLIAYKWPVDYPQYGGVSIYG